MQLERRQKIPPRPIKRVMMSLEQNFPSETDLTQLAQIAGISKYNLCKNFNRNYGISPMRWLWNCRTYLAAELLVNDEQATVASISSLCGFKSRAHFNRLFGRLMGLPPEQFRSWGLKIKKLNAAHRDDSGEVSSIGPLTSVGNGIKKRTVSSEIVRFCTQKALLSESQRGVASKLPN